jgi:1-Cys peroxiredoxin 6
MADEHKVVTPVDWKPGDKVLIPPSVSNEDAKKLFGDIETEPLPSGRDYMRFARVRGE